MYNIIRNIELLIIAKTEEWMSESECHALPYMVMHGTHFLLQSTSSAPPKFSVKACKSLHMQKMEDIHKNMARWTEQLLVG